MLEVGGSVSSTKLKVGGLDPGEKNLQGSEVPRE